jgi:hypothetical protein
MTLLAAVLLAGCTAASPGGAIDHPDGAVSVLEVRYEGGFVPPEHVFSALPSFTLLGDGRVFVVGPVPAIFPGPALPNLQVRRLTDGGMQALLELAKDSGALSQDATYNGAAQFVADAPDTVFALNAAGRQVRVSVYALGFLEGTQPGMSAEEVAVHRSLNELRDRLVDLDAWLADEHWAEAAWQPYQPEALALLVRPAGDVDHGVPAGRMAWPLEQAPAAFGVETRLEIGRCGVVSGDEAALMLEGLHGATQITEWMHHGTPYSVVARPLLPGEELACPEGFGA